MEYTSVCSRQSGARTIIMCKKMKHTLDLLNEIERETKNPEELERHLALIAMKVLFEGVEIFPQGSSLIKRTENKDICPIALMNLIVLRYDGIKNVIHECPLKKEFVYFRVRE